MVTRDRVLLPPSRRPPRPLPPWLALVALVGLAGLGLSTIPAAWRRITLSTDLGRLRCETEIQERRLLRTQGAIRAARGGRFAREKALRRLLLPPPGR